jgi:electron transfer flavoprotein beta subunit
MGPPQADQALREALSLGADRAALLSDRAFAGADTLATSYTLSRAIDKLRQDGPIDLVICGKQAIDGDTAQVGPGIATRLGYTQFTYVTEIMEVDPADRRVTVKRKVESGSEVIRGRLPAVLTVELELTKVKRASLPRLIDSLRASIEVWNADAVQAEPQHVGLKGSPTWVRRIFSPPVKKGGPRFDAREDARQAVEASIATLFHDTTFALQLLKR